MLNILTTIARFFVGILFIFSGFVKVIDPLGFSYKLSEYFEVFGMPGLSSISVLLAIVLCLLEIAFGVQLILGLWKRTTAWGLLLMIVFFTFLTFYSAYFNKVTDCGCFGDAIPLNPWQSFYKDLILLVLIVWLFIRRNHLKGFLNYTQSMAIWWLFFLSNSFFAYWGLAHLPIIDFRAYAEGKSIVEGMKTAEELGLEPPLYATDYRLIHKETGEEIIVPSYSYTEDKLWETYKFEESLGDPYKVRDGYEPPVHDFVLTAADGTDLTQTILNAEEIFLIVSYDLKKTDIDAHENEIKALSEALNDFAVLHVGLSGSNFEDIETFRHQVQAGYPYLNADPTALKTIVRASPGIVLLKKGVVVKKWHYNDLPDGQTLKEKYLD